MSLSLRLNLWLTKINHGSITTIRDGVYFFAGTIFCPWFGDVSMACHVDVDHDTEHRPDARLVSVLWRTFQDKSWIVKRILAVYFTSIYKKQLLRRNCGLDWTWTCLTLTCGGDLCRACCWVPISVVGDGCAGWRWFWEKKDTVCLLLLWRFVEGCQSAWLTCSLSRRQESWAYSGHSGTKRDPIGSRWVLRNRWVFFGSSECCFVNEQWNTRQEFDHVPPLLQPLPITSVIASLHACLSEDLLSCNCSAIRWCCVLDLLTSCHACLL